MIKNVKKSICFVLVLMLMFSVNIVALAQGTTSITVSNSSIGVGDSTVISVGASTSGTVTIKYTASLLSLSDCTASGYSADGNTITFNGTSGDLTFKAIDEGTASIIVSSSSCSGSSTTIAISGQGTGEVSEPAVAEQSEETSEENVDSQPEEAAVEEIAATGIGTLNADGGFDIDGVSYVVSERYSDSEIPAGFSKTTLKIGGGTYAELTNGSLVIIYLKPADNTKGSGVFYLYDEGAGTVSKFDIVSGVGGYVIIGTPDALLSSSFYETGIETDNGTHTAYSYEGSEFYYIYGTGNNGSSGWYLYDPAIGTISRADTSAFSTTTTVTESTSLEEATQDAANSYDPSEVYKTKLKKLRKIISALVIVCVILFFILLNMILKNRAGKDDEDVDDIFSKTPDRVQKQPRLPRSVAFSKSSDVFGDDEEDDDEEEVVENKKTVKKPTKNGNTNNDSNSGIEMMDLNDL